MQACEVAFHVAHASAQTQAAELAAELDPTGQAVQTSAAPARPLEYELAVHAHEEAPDVDAERAGQAVQAEPAAAAE